MRATIVAVCAFASVASAQLELPRSSVRPTPGQVRNAGVYHLATGTWTRKAASAALGAEVIYDNTCLTGYYYDPLSGNRFVEEGRLPSPSSPTNLGSRPGCATTYVIDGFQIAYCTDRMSLGTYLVNFYESYTSCTSVTGVVPTASFSLTSLPAAPATGVGTCWAVTVDLEAPPQQTSLAFAMRADGDGTYAAPSSTNYFGWSIECSLPDAEQAASGPLYGGEPSVCTSYDGTRWDNGSPPAWPANMGEAGTGMGTNSWFRIENGPTTPGCYFIGSDPFSAFHLELYADACASAPGLAFCAGDGSGTACPCGNASALGANEGCLSSLAIGAKLAPIGEPSLSNDSLVLIGSQMPSGSSALYFQGTTRLNGGAGSMFGDGLRCAGGAVLRLGTLVNSTVNSYYPTGTQPSVSIQGQVLSPGARTYQVWYRNSSDFCTSATFNLSNGWELVWGP